jgi:hypothetical protein
MNRKFWISVLVIFVISMAFGFLIHALLLGPDYAALAGLFRSQEEQAARFFYMLLAHAVFAFAFVWIFLKGRESKSFLLQGIRYGVAIALLATVPTYLIYYVVQPVPVELAFKQIAFDSGALVILAIVLAWIHR